MYLLLEANRTNFDFYFDIYFLFFSGLDLGSLIISFLFSFFPFFFFFPFLLYFFKITFVFSFYKYQNIDM
ncbi:hypothetical protein BDV24DRAFT_146272, partial [Aspergillus arachidicola]